MEVIDKLNSQESEDPLPRGFGYSEAVGIMEALVAEKSARKRNRNRGSKKFCECQN